MNAPERAKEIKAAIAMIIAFFTALWGWLGWAILIWIGCILLDYISGSMAARREKNWSSDIARDGLWHKAGEICAVLVAALCDIALDVMIRGAGITLPFEIGPMLTPIVLLWYTLTEVGSIIENCGKLGQYKDSIDQSQGKEEKPPDPEQGEPEGRHEKRDAAGQTGVANRE